MKPTQLEIQCSMQILKPVHKVFEAIVNPEQMTNYFISKSSGRMEEGKKLIWNFPEIKADVPVKVDKVIKDEYISYYWENGESTQLVEMSLKPYKDGTTIVTVTEKGMENNEAGIKWLKGNTEGWANFLACLKAWMEYGVHLRKGAFDYRFDKK
ncbi:SRPBCC domain-containing protein [Flavobacterium sp. ST-75]|uniref:SRPBCC domain-containing protein n=1 Tax=Flavobacterium rhizophilum TaxID=3163296 RepID=A0ABW8YHN9_9FLAO